MLVAVRVCGPRALQLQAFGMQGVLACFHACVGHYGVRVQAGRSPSTWLLAGASLCTQGYLSISLAQHQRAVCCSVHISGPSARGSCVCTVRCPNWGPICASDGCRCSPCRRLTPQGTRCIRLGRRIRHGGATQGLRLVDCLLGKVRQGSRCQKASPAASVRPQSLRGTPPVLFVVDG